MNCASSIKKINLSQYLSTTSFKQDEINSIHEYFCKYSSDKMTLNLKEFRMSLGVLGAKSCDFVFRRIFELIDDNKNMKISFDKYIKFLNLANYGTNDEKLAHTFKFFDLKNKGIIDVEDFREVIYSICEFFSIVSTTPMKVRTIDVDNVYKDILKRCDKKNLDFKSFLDLNNRFPELIDFFEIFNNKLLNTSIYNINRERLSQLEEINRKITSLIHKCGIYCETNKKITICPKSHLYSSTKNPIVPSNVDDNNSSKINQEIENNDWKTFKLSQKVDLLDFNKKSDSSLDWDLDEEVNISLGSKLLTEENKDEIESCKKINFDVFQPFEPKSKKFKSLINDLSNQEINLQDCIIIPKRGKFIEYLEEISEILTEIIKEVDPQKQKINRRQGMAVQPNNNVEVDKEFFLNIPCNSVDSKGLIHFGNNNVELVLNMMIGIKSSINSNGDTQKLYDLSKNDDAFNEYNLYNYSQNIFEKETKCKFFDYSPKVFSNLRKMYNIKNEDYLKSLGPENFLGNLILIKNRCLRELVSTGKSGSFFYFSYDSKFVLKTISEREFKLFQSILKDYYNHMLDHKDTLLQRFFGLHIMYFKNIKMHFIIMNNVFFTNVKIHYKYDLKGSLYQRISRDPDKDNYDDYDFNIPMKDVDLLDRKFKFDLSKEESDDITNQIKIDSSFLSSKNINDYSFLIGIHDIDYNGKGISSPLPGFLNKISVPLYIKKKDLSNTQDIRKPFFEKDRGGIISKDGRNIYFIGIIDIFTDFGAKKKAENLFKSIFQGPNISCKPPIEYYERFHNFMGKIFDKSTN